MQRRFLVDQVAADPTGAYAGKLLDLAREADVASAAPALAAAQVLVGRIDAAIQSANLGQRYALARDDGSKQAVGGPAPTGTAIASPKP